MSTLAAELAEGRNVMVHCRMGIGRSAVLAACGLVAQGSSVDEAFAAIETARGLGVPDTDAQRAWVDEMARSLQALR